MPTEKALAVPDLTSGVSASQADQRLKLLADQNDGFAKAYVGSTLGGVDAAYDRALRLMNSPAKSAFDLDVGPTTASPRTGGCGGS